MIIGYARVSKKIQNLDLQLDALNKYGAERIFEEKITGVKKDREKLTEALSLLRKGDTFVIWRLDRLGRTAKQLLDLAEQFNNNGINFVSLHDGIDTTTSLGKFVFTILCAMAEMERNVIIERTNKGLESARARGRVGGRPRTDKDKVKTALTMYDSGEHSIGEITKATGVSKRTLYNYISERKTDSVPEPTVVSEPEQSHEDYAWELIVDGYKSMGVNPYSATG